MDITKSFTCPHCGSVYFSTCGILEEILRYKHSDNKTDFTPQHPKQLPTEICLHFGCNNCGKYFMFKAQLSNIQIT